ncbi:YktB family protein [Salisediminibacterium halotolerans]|uniref:UPF0637 protein SAMN05444126_1021 n=1 Tax=Salisediminibacterium halotolerans TaxID=517425 RepID=A0A1H9PQA7_9BACI|nr:DUF1054 domain-containing protein [Salisediminibacterium haloalkalitolerans]SER50496.1 Uncharacterized protein YktB, UPF0637 family [Salisediminibacterium haloalkalitolerans]
MVFDGFTQEDFDVFAVEGLDERMTDIKSIVRPKLEALGEIFAEKLSAKTGEPMYYHVAKHARRKVNPPDDTWVAFANDKRGYKKLPHFQIGLFGSHVFIWFAVIYESPVKKPLANEFQEQINDITQRIPEHFHWSVDHTKPEAVNHGDLSEDELERMIERLGSVKKAELLCGLQIASDDPRLQDGDEFIATVEHVFDTVLPLYEAASHIYTYQS